MPKHDDTNEYNKRMPQPGPKADCCGYPNNVASTQTQKTRGTGAAVRGNKHSTKMG